MVLKIEIEHMENTQDASFRGKTKPLLPIDDLLGHDVSNAESSISDNLDKVVTTGMMKVKSTENERVKTIINSEINQMTQKQDKTNEEIKKKVAELQSLRERNLVVAGAVSSLRKILQNIESK